MITISISAAPISREYLMLVLYYAEFCPSYWIMALNKDNVYSRILKNQEDQEVDPRTARTHHIEITIQDWHSYQTTHLDMVLRYFLRLETYPRHKNYWIMALNKDNVYFYFYLVHIKQDDDPRTARITWPEELS